MALYSSYSPTHTNIKNYICWQSRAGNTSEIKEEEKWYLAGNDSICIELQGDILFPYQTFSGCFLKDIKQLHHLNESTPFLGGHHHFEFTPSKDGQTDPLRPLTAFLRVAVVADEDLLARGAEERRPVDGVVEAQAAVVEDVDVAGADLGQRLELERGDPALLQDQQRNAASAAKIWKGGGGRDLLTGIWHKDGDEEVGD